MGDAIQCLIMKRLTEKSELVHVFSATQFILMKMCYVTLSMMMRNGWTSSVVVLC
ncbi:hypothetical protein HanIR_Chr16g0823301 [Helianthus annuus]|nr:hypothetical protein HanIR_Chr16g0823301 [Helianthus annuus]